MSSFDTDSADFFNRKLGGYGKLGGGLGHRADGAQEAQMLVDEREDTVIERYPSNYPPIPVVDDLDDLARKIRLMPGTLSARLQEELFSIMSKKIPWPLRQIWARKIWQTLFVWSITKCHKENPPTSSISMERLLADITSSGCPKPAELGVEQQKPSV